MADYTVTVDFSDLKLFNDYLNTTSDKVEAKFRKTAESFSQFKSVSNDFNRLKSSIDPAFAATKRYQDSVITLQRSLSYGVITQDEYNRSLAQLDALAENGALSLNRLGNSSRFVGRSMSRGSMIAQQFGYQVGDFFVQIQSGTNAMIAFAQQGTQLAGLIPGIAGAIVGIGLAASTAALGFFRSKESVEDFEDAIKQADQAAKDISTTLRVMRLGLGDENELAYFEEILRLTAELSNLENTPVGGRSGQIASQRERELQVIRDSIAATQEKLDNYRKEAEQVEYIRELNSRLNSAIRSNNEAERERLETQRELARSFEVEFNNLSESIRLRGIAAQFGQDSIEYEEAALRLKIDQYEAQLVANGYSEIQVSLLTEAYAIEQLMSTVDLASPIGAAVERAGALAVRLGMSLAIINAIANTSLAPRENLSGLSGQELLPEPVFDGPRPLNRPNDIDFNNPEGVVDPFGNSLIPDLPSGGSGRGGGGGSGSVQPSDLDNLREAIKLEQELLGKTEAQQRVIRALGLEWESYGEDTVNSLVSSIEAMEQFSDAVERNNGLVNSATTSFENSFLSIIDGTSTVSDAFRTMASDIIKELYRVLVLQQAIGSFDAATGVGSGLAGFLGNALRFIAPIPIAQAKGGAWEDGVQYFAKGGVVNTRKSFNHSGGQGVMGEAGPEAIMPLSRTKTGDLGVKVSGDVGKETVVITQNFNISGNGDETIKKIIVQQIPNIQSATLKSVNQAMKRTGNIR